MLNDGKIFRSQKSFVQRSVATGIRADCSEDKKLIKCCLWQCEGPQVAMGRRLSVRARAAPRPIAANCSDRHNVPPPLSPRALTLSSSLVPSYFTSHLNSFWVETIAAVSHVLRIARIQLALEKMTLQRIDFDVHFKKALTLSSDSTLKAGLERYQFRVMCGMSNCSKPVSNSVLIMLWNKSIATRCSVFGRTIVVKRDDQFIVVY